MRIEHRIIEDRAAFGELREQWNELARRLPDDHAFMRHEWFANWWDHLPHGGEMKVLACRRDGRLVGAAPLFLRDDSRRGAGFKLLSFMQSGITPRSSFLVDPAEEPAAVFAGLDAVKGWDLAEFKGMARDQEMTGKFIAWLEERGPCVVEDGAVSPYQTLPEDWTAFEKTRSKGFRKRFRNSLNRCKNAKSFAIECLETHAAFEESFQDMLAISRKSWKAEGGTDLVTQSGMAEFFRSFARDTAAEGLWVVYMLRLEGRPVAFDFYLRHGGRLVGLRWEYDNEYRYYMPGVVVHVQALKDLLERHPGGEFDLSGAETDFKSGLVDQAREHADVTCGSDGMKSRLLMGMKRGLRTMRGGS